MTELRIVEHLFKTVYFPRERVRTGTSARVTVSLPAAPRLPEIDENFIRYAQGLSSRDFRLALGDPDLEALEELAHQEGRSLSNICLRLLIKHYQAGGGQLGANGKNIVGQLTLPLLEATSAVESVSGNEPKADLGVTFRDNLRQHVYGWYPYVEGFSATYTQIAHGSRGVTSVCQ